LIHSQDYHRVLIWVHYLFSVFINDLPNWLEETQAARFADDTRISTSGTSLLETENKMNNDLHNFNIWLETNKLNLNKEKNIVYVNSVKEKTETIFRKSQHNYW
jgi:hypothetical protein